MKDTVSKRYLVCVLAHNEERVIADAIRSIFEQQIDPAAALDIYIFSNGSTDRTNEIVGDLAAADSRVHLVALPEKGKVYAVRESINHFRSLKEKGVYFDRVFYLDADVRLPDRNTLVRLSMSLDRSGDLFLVSSYPRMIPDASSSNWLLKRLAATRESIMRGLGANIVRGACYVIRLETLFRVDYPQHILSDDLYLEVRLSGHFLMDYAIVTETVGKSTVEGERRRDLFTLIATEQLHNQVDGRRMPPMDPSTARREWSLSYPRQKLIFKYLITHFNMAGLLVILMWFPIHRYNVSRAKKIVRESREREINLIDYWSTKR